MRLAENRSGVLDTNPAFSQTSYIMGLPTILRLDDITVSLPQKRQDLDKDGLHRVDRLVAYTKLTIVLDEITAAGYVVDWCSNLE